MEPWLIEVDKDTFFEFSSKLAVYNRTQGVSGLFVAYPHREHRRLVRSNNGGNGMKFGVSRNNGDFGCVKTNRGAYYVTGCEIDGERVVVGSMEGAKKWARVVGNLASRGGSWGFRADKHLVKLDGPAGFCDIPDFKGAIGFAALVGSMAFLMDCRYDGRSVTCLALFTDGRILDCDIHEFHDGSHSLRRELLLETMHDHHYALCDR